MMFFCLFGLVLLCFHWVSAERGAHLKAMLWRLICTFNSRAQLSERARLSTSAQLLDT